MIPFVTCDPLTLGPLTLSPWGFLTACGFFFWDIVVSRHAKKLGYDGREMRALQLWGMLCGVYGAHILDTLFYRPGELLHRPWALLIFWENLSSMGGVIGCVVGGLIWTRYRLRIEHGRPSLTRRPVPLPLLPMADVIVSALPIGFGFGRAGCAIVHDHPGLSAPPSELFAVAFPRTPGEGYAGSYGPIHIAYGTDPRYDLGLLECVFLFLLALGVAWTWIQPKRPAVGMYSAVLAMIYAPVRFALDFLRPRDDSGDMRLGPFTFAQWTTVVMLGLGVYLLRHARRLAREGTDPADALRAALAAASPVESAAKV
ncbi:MAG: prolipoprotein diacylglyceryl transferase family protein [Byssovorax sp.]